MADDEFKKPENRRPLFSRAEIRVLGLLLAFWLYFSYVIPHLEGLLRNREEELAEPIQRMMSISDFVTGYVPPLTLLSGFFLYLIAKTYRK